MDVTSELIIRQQANVKALLEIDDRIQQLRKTNTASRTALHEARENCKQYALDTVRLRQGLLEDQTKEIEQFKEEAAYSITVEVKRQEGRIKKLKEDIKDLNEAIEKDRANREKDLEALRRDYEAQIEQLKEKFREQGSSRPTPRSFSASTRTQQPPIIDTVRRKSGRDLLSFNGEIIDDPFEESDDELLLLTEDVYENDNNGTAVRTATRRSNRLSIPRRPPTSTSAVNRKRRRD